MGVHSGLTRNEAAQRLIQYGPNELRDLHKVTAVGIALRQIKGNSIIYLLIVAALASFFVGKALTGWIILLVVFVVIIVGFIQEYKAEKAISALEKMIMPITLVVRDGITTEVVSGNVVPGDLVLLRVGERIPADGRLVEARELRVNEAVLTGESQEVKKLVAPAGMEMADDNRVFMGTYVVNGKGVFEVEHTGMNTRFGGIAETISETEKSLPLREKVNQISKLMVIIAIIFSVITGVLTMLRLPVWDANGMVEILILMIAMAVSAFPEGFPVVLISTLAAGASRMAKHNAIVNRMSIIETLGETTVICSDKTGTITTGEMTIRRIYIHPILYEVSGVGFEGEGVITAKGHPVSTIANTPLRQLILGGLICNEAVINRTGEDHQFKVVGTPTEGALLVLGAKVGIHREDSGLTILEEMPFNSERKMMSVLVADKNGKKTVFAKGAPEVLIENCSRIVLDGQVRLLTAALKKEVLAADEEQTSQTLRTLAIAYKDVDQTENLLTENDLVWIGLVGMEDPPREEVQAAIETAKHSGIQTKMITGDNKATARAIAREVGITGELLEGYQIEDATDAELRTLVPQTTIFARVKPEHKLRIVRALKENGEIVAMTGDGVNDAPALKEAHIGIAMGKNGTDVSRSVSDLILKDDNFATIVDAIREGRTIFNNLRKFTSYQLSCNGGELLILLVGTILAPYLGWQVPLLLALQILFMNLVTDNLPAIALGFNPTSHDIMRQKPRQGRALLTPGLVRLVVFTALLMAVVTLAAYFIALNVLQLDVPTARTTALLTLILMEIVGAYQFRSFRKTVLTRSPLVNRYLWYASLLALSATVVVIYTPLNQAFGTVPIGGIGWLIGLSGALLFTLIYDLVKSLRGAMAADV